MLVRKLAPPSSYKVLKSYETLLVWCSDGWVYDTVTNVRRQFMTVGADVFKMEEEITEQRVYSDVQYSENITVEIISKSPRIWVERNGEFCQCYEEVAQ